MTGTPQAGVARRDRRRRSGCRRRPPRARELAIDDARAADGQRRLVGAAEPPCAAPRENRRRHTMYPRSTRTTHADSMSEARIGRVLVASLHQAIADLLPTRLEFYENWLNVAGLREGTIGLAPLTAVLSFLRTEGQAYTPDHGARRRVRGGLDVRERAAARAAAHPRAARRRCGRARRCARRARWFEPPIPGSRADHADEEAAPSRSICADRSSARCARRRCSRCAGSTPPRSRGVLELFDVPAEAQVNECRAVGGAGAAVVRLGRRSTGRATATARSRHDRRRGWLARRWLAGAAPAAGRSRRRQRRRASWSCRSRTPARDGRTYWLGEAVAVLIADDLNARGLGAITRPSRERALRPAAPAAATPC